jgi:uncharacterized phage protein gp47/JayE
VTLEFKTRDQIVQDIINSILSKIPDIDFSDGEPLKTIIEAIVTEMDYQNWQLKQVYDNAFIDTSYGDDLSNLVKLLGITRNPAKGAFGKVKFYRETPATLDYLIPAGTIVETLPDAEGVFNSYQTTENVVLLTGQTFIDANVKAITLGLSSNVTSNKVTTINNPPLGIESVTNIEPIAGGENEESDDDLRNRAKSVLETSGQGTVTAITNKIQEIPGVKYTKVLDMQRGIGTLDILVLGDTVPMPSDIMDSITKMAMDTKSGGIDILIYEPTYTNVNVDITLTMKEGYNILDVTEDVNTSINNYFATLGIGDTFVKNQLVKYILDNTIGRVADLNINSPSSNITEDSTSLITLGTITLH